jgi:hypothetical protein
MLLPIDAVRHVLLVPNWGVGVVIIVTGVLVGKTCTQKAVITYTEKAGKKIPRMEAEILPTIHNAQVTLGSLSRGHISILCIYYKLLNNLGG